MTSDLLTLLRRIPGHAQQIAHHQQLPPRSACFAEPAAPLPEALRQTLETCSITRLYIHQAAALDAARAGDHLGIVTATASGKTLCYQLPILETLLEHAQNCALLLFPTKALAHDQHRVLYPLADTLGIHIGTLDGDTAHPQRDKLRSRAQIILSNPDMLHRTLLPSHRRWATLLSHLRFVVLDEAHIYRGVFGTHVALVVRRLRRLCAHYGSSPQFICCSATSANPQEHLSALVGDAVRVIDEDGAPQGERSFVFWNPPLIEHTDGRRERPCGGSNTTAGGRRRSTNAETANLLATLVHAGVKTLAFTRTRRGAELVLRYTREALERHNSLVAEQIASYRAGYVPEERRRLERRFLEGELRGLVSTNALELGIDIGGVDAVIIGGFPGSIASTWQQAGRAGRSQGASLAVLVAQDDPLDQFYMRHPDQFFARPHEYARIALDNPYILSDQLRCAAYELPLHEADDLWFGQTFASLHDWLLNHGQLVQLSDGRTTTSEERPSARVNIRSADGEAVTLRDIESGRTIEQISATRAPFEIHPGAIYLHQGDSYLVSALHAQHAEARRCQVNYYTQPIEETEIAVKRIKEQRQIGPAQLFLGVVEVTRQVIGYRRKEHYSEAVVSEHDLSLSPQTFRTVAVWWSVPDAWCRVVEQSCDSVLDGLHAMEHASIGLLPLFAQCDRADIGGLSTNLHASTSGATIFVYDAVPGGVGIAQIGYEQAEDWWRQTAILLNDCPCLEGCPSCIQSPKCGNGNQHLSKIGAATLATLLLGQALPVKDLQRSLAAATPTNNTAQQVIEELWGRLARARATPPGPRRAALLVALRYRVRVERTTLTEAPAQAELADLERELGTL